MSEKLISVIIPAYNHEKYVQEAIQSVIDQTYQNIELIIIDDGSKDATFQKIKEMETKCHNRFVRFIYQTQKNQGTCVTQNHLIELSKGDYIALIASDDKYTPNALADMALEMNKNPELALVVGKNYIMDGDSRQCYWDKDRENVYDKTKAKWLSFSNFLSDVTKVDFFSSDFGSYATLVRNNHIANGYLIRKSILQKTGGYRPEAPLEDYWLMLQLSKYGKMKYIDVPTFYYRWHANNTIKQTTRMKNFTAQTFQFEYEQLLKKKQYTFLKIFLQKSAKTVFNFFGIFSILKIKFENQKVYYFNFFHFTLFFLKIARHK